MGAADLAASSAARLRLRMASSTCLPNPALRNVFSTLAASGGSRIFTAASLKKPSTAESLSALFSAPFDKASFNPATISSELSEPLFPPLTLLSAFLAPLSKPCALAVPTIRKEQSENNTTAIIFFIMDIFFACKNNSTNC